MVARSFTAISHTGINLPRSCALDETEGLSLLRMCVIVTECFPRGLKDIYYNTTYTTDLFDKSSNHLPLFEISFAIEMARVDVANTVRIAGS